MVATASMEFGSIPVPLSNILCHIYLDQFSHQPIKPSAAYGGVPADISDLRLSSSLSPDFSFPIGVVSKFFWLGGLSSLWA